MKGILRCLEVRERRCQFISILGEHFVACFFLESNFVIAKSRDTKMVKEASTPTM